ncbi:hypothetical protein ACPA0F_18405 [Solibacillus silvestris]
MSVVKEKVRVVVGRDVRYIEGLCKSCPHFSGTSTCRILTDRIYLEDSITNIETYSHLDRDKAVKNRSKCNLFNRHKTVNTMDGTINFQGGEENFKVVLLKWIKANCYGADSISLESHVIEKIFDAIKLFKGGDVENLISKHPAIILNAGNNPLYSKPFQYFTGLNLSFLNVAIGSTKLEKVAREYLKEMSKYRKVLGKMVTVSMLYSRNEQDPENFEYNFRRFFVELMLGKDPEAYFLRNEVSQHTTLSNHWGYNLNYREALKEAGGFTEKDVPKIKLSLNNKPFNELSADEIKMLDKQFTQEKHEFFKFAMSMFVEQVVSP